jgi:hypothetical protein
MNSEFLSDQEVIRITNDEFVKVDKNDLAGNFDLKLSISTAEEDNNKAQELAFMLQTGAASADPGEVRMIRAEIARLRKMPELAKKIEEYEPQPDPTMEQMKQLELAKLQAEIQLLNAQAMAAQSGAQLSGAKVNTEGAKAANLVSDTDQKNLDFIEQETGTKQARDLQLHGEQARSQMEAKVLDRQFQREDDDKNFLRDYLLSKVKTKA